MNPGIAFLVKIAVLMLLGLIGAYQYEGVRKIFFDFGGALIIPLVAIAAFVSQAESDNASTKTPLRFPDSKKEKENDHDWN